jgi:uncharacterized protein YggE
MTEKNIFLAIALGGLFYLGGQYVLSQPQRIQQEVEANREITVEGVGEVHALPDLAKITLGVQTEPKQSAAQALQELTAKFNAVVDAVKAEGVEEEDITATNVSINPLYDYPNGQQVLRGFQASESIEVKIRDLDSIGSVLTRATSQGLNQVGGVQFTFDDPTAVKLEAQEKAIENARQKAETLAKTLGVGLGRVKSFSAGDNQQPPMPLFDRSAASLEAAGGDLQVPSGSQDITATVSITYELK